MAIGEHKNKSPYHGVPVVCFFMIAVPITLYFIFKGIFFNSQTMHSDQLNEATARTVGFGIGVLFHLSLIVCGVLHESFLAVVNRVAEFFDNWKISFKFACSCYGDQIREGGVAFWILFGVMVANFFVFWSGLKIVLTLLL